METDGIYQINYESEEKRGKCYIGVTERKIKDRIEEHKKDVKYERIGTALAREAATKNKNKL